MPEEGGIQLSIVIVNYNVRYFLEQALQSVFRAIGNMSVEVFVVDNQSVDDSVAMVRDKFPSVRLIENRENVGFSKANNQAIRQARGKYVLLLNPDTVVEEDTFEKCHAFMEAHSQAGALGVRMIDGAGKFLPESKRGFPSPWVAFCKASGLSRLFPRSRWFNGYHLGYLSEQKTHAVDVLSGAFMFIRRKVLSEVGLLDETFFMYGEDIDLSFRIRQAGYSNYYFADTRIIHYKGESTKKGSLNYVRAFYQAMIIFARKHFRKGKARRLVGMLQVAIYLQATLTVLRNAVRRAALPLLDALGFYLGLLVLKDFWANYHFNDPEYFSPAILYTNFPLYVVVWLVGIYLSGGYDEGGGLRRLIRGLLIATLVSAAIYGFLDMEYRPSRALLLMGSAWALGYAVLLRYLVHFLQYRNLRPGERPSGNLVIAGTTQESKRVRQLLREAGVNKNIIGTVAPAGVPVTNDYLSGLERLNEIVQIYRVKEVIFCSSDVAAQEVMHWMSVLGPSVEYKMVPRESLSIIGSSNKNASGELYTLEIQFRIDQPIQRRNKRILDLLLFLAFLLSLPIHLLWLHNRLGFLQNLGRVVLGYASWVGYIPAGKNEQKLDLPKLRPGVLNPADQFAEHHLSEAAIRRINFYYAKDYDAGRDLEIIWKGIRKLGRQPA